MKQPTPTELRIDLFGNLDAVAAEQLEREVVMLANRLSARSFTVLYSTIGMTDCTMDARPVLVRLQKQLAGLARRTAYLDDRPRFRGLALWVMHLSEDANAKAVATDEQARLWVASRAGRVEDAMARVGALR